jgi:hypothetical protein
MLYNGRTMKKSIFFSALLISSSVIAQTPVFNSAEVKISYPCEVLESLPKEKEENEIISFFETNDGSVYKSNYILRKRVGEKQDFTIKYRIDKESSVVLDPLIYKNLIESQNGDMKCEYDITYQPEHYKTSYSCSFKTEGLGLHKEHLDFMQMLKRNISGWDQSLKGMREIKVEATSWKLKVPKNHPFSKKPSIDRWIARGECKLEVSGKFDVSGDPDAKALEGLSFLKSQIKSSPSPIQGNKTAWALGIN